MSGKHVLIALIAFAPIEASGAEKQLARALEDSCRQTNAAIAAEGFTETDQQVLMNICVNRRARSVIYSSGLQSNECERAEKAWTGEAMRRRLSVPSVWDCN